MARPVITTTSDSTTGRTGTAATAFSGQRKNFVVTCQRPGSQKYPEIPKNQ